MSTEKRLTPKDLQFSKGDVKILRKYLEKYYCTQLLLFNNRNGFHKDANKTLRARLDQRFRLKIKPVELVLHDIGSEFMSNVETTPTIRKTATVNARSNGLMQGREAVLGHMRIVRDKRSGKL